MLSLGVDFGTSGARAIAISAAGHIVEEVSVQFDGRAVASIDAWTDALWELLSALPIETRCHIGRIAINGTSATMLLCDGQGQGLTEALMYNDASGRAALDDVRAIAPANCAAVLSATSTLVKALWLHSQKRPEVMAAQSVKIVHQADFLAQRLHRQPFVTDYHNALKLGYDVHALSYPDWLLGSPVASWLPEVLMPGSAIAPVHPSIARAHGLPETCQICAGTTDSIAAFLASGAHKIGEAVTSLGSTLVLKLLSPQPVNDPSAGIYSHRLGDLWLVGGASNTGGAVLKRFFSAMQLQALSKQIDPTQVSSYDYYPLNQPGERFPISDPDYPPRLSPRPESDVEFLHGLLDAIARIEAQGYQKLSSSGAAQLQQVYSAGGGAANEVWQTLRANRLGVSVRPASQTQAAYGSAQLAKSGLDRFTAS